MLENTKIIVEGKEYEVIDYNHHSNIKLSELVLTSSGVKPFSETSETSDKGEYLVIVPVEETVELFGNTYNKKWLQQTLGAALTEEEYQ